MSPGQIIERLDLFDTMLAGNSAQRHNLEVTPGEPRTGNARKEADFAQFETWLMQRTCSVMGVNPASIGHHSDTYKDSQETALKSAKNGHIAQLLAFAREDPESFDFIYSVLRNPAAARAHQEELLRRAEAKAHEMKVVRVSDVTDGRCASTKDLCFSRGSLLLRVLLETGRLET